VRCVPYIREAYVRVNCTVSCLVYCSCTLTALCEILILRTVKICKRAPAVLSKSGDTILLSIVKVLIKKKELFQGRFKKNVLADRSFGLNFSLK
jgi:hypothetical protein